MASTRLTVVGCSTAILIVAGLMLPSACVTDKSTKAEKKLSAEEQKAVDDARIETEVGRNMAGRLLQFYGNSDDDDLVNYVNQVGNFVANYGEFPDRRYMFEIIDSDIVNAFACPGGYILVTMGALRHAKNEAELAAVLSHETVHVGKKHMFDTLTTMSKEDMEKAEAEAAKALNLPESVTVRERPKAESSAIGDLAARYLSGSAAGLSIFAAAKAGMAVMMETGLGAEKEFEADQEGVRYAVRAGYEPKALIEFLCRLEEKRGIPRDQCLTKQVAKDSGKTILDKTHPAVKDRVENINRLLASLKADEIIGATGASRFAKYSKRLPPAKAEKK